MLCPSCGIDVGDRVGLCEQCAEQAAAARQEEQARLAEQLARGEKIDKPQRQPKELPSFSVWSLGYTLFYTLLGFLLIAISIGVIYAFHPEHAVVESLVLGLIFSLMTIGLVCWVWLWIQIMMENIWLALVSLILPIAVWWIVVAHPERTWKPFLAHLAAGIACWALIGYHVKSTHQNPFIQMESILTGQEVNTEYRDRSYRR